MAETGGETTKLGFLERVKKLFTLDQEGAAEAFKPPGSGILQGEAANIVRKSLSQTPVPETPASSPQPVQPPIK